MDADKFRDRAAVWRRRAAERHDARAREADLRLAEEYERLADSLSASSTPLTPHDPSPGLPEDAVSAL